MQSYIHTYIHVHTYIHTYIHCDTHIHNIHIIYIMHAYIHMYICMYIRLHGKYSTVGTFDAHKYYTLIIHMYYTLITHTLIYLICIYMRTYIHMQSCTHTYISIPVVDQIDNKYSSQYDTHYHCSSKTRENDINIIYLVTVDLFCIHQFRGGTGI